MAHMRQVTKEEFEVLTRFHPGEIRYYVDVSKATGRRSSAKTVTKTRRKKRAKRTEKQSRKSAINGTGRGFNKPVQLISSSKVDSYGAGTIVRAVGAAVVRSFEGDPARVWGRTDLVNHVTRETGLRIESVTPAASKLLQDGVIGYKEAA